MKKFNKERLNKEFDKYLERPFVILDFVIFTVLILPMIFVFSESTLRIFHFIDISIWVLILLEVAFKLWVVPFKIHYIIHDWEDIICAILPILPNFKIIKEFRHIHISQIMKAIRVIRAALFVKRIDRRLRLIFKGDGKETS